MRRPRRAHGRDDAAAGARDLFIAGPLQPHLEFAGTVAAMHEMGVAIDQRRRDQPAAEVLRAGRRAKSAGQIGLGPDPERSPRLQSRDRRILDQAIARRPVIVATRQLARTALCCRIGPPRLAEFGLAESLCMSVYAIMSIHNGGPAMIFAKRALAARGLGARMSASRWTGGQDRQRRAGCGRRTGRYTGRALLPALSQPAQPQLSARHGRDDRTPRAGRDSFWTWRDLMYRFLDHLTPDEVRGDRRLVVHRDAGGGLCRGGRVSLSAPPARRRALCRSGRNVGPDLCGGGGRPASG